MACISIRRAMLLHATRGGSSSEVARQEFQVRTIMRLCQPTACNPLLYTRNEGTRDAALYSTEKQEAKNNAGQLNNAHIELP